MRDTAAFIFTAMSAKRAEYRESSVTSFTSKVQEAITTKKNPQGRHRVNGDYLLTGKLFCGHCKVQ